MSDKINNALKNITTEMNIYKKLLTKVRRSKEIHVNDKDKIRKINNVLTKI